jgi:hypothetical protein
VGQIAKIVLGYVLWFASMALSLWAVLMLRVVLISDVPIGLLRVSAWSLRLWNYAGSALVGLTWLVLAIATEGYFLEASEETLPVMLRRAAKILSAEVVFLSVVYGIRLMI